jgi:WD40 repeat protein
VFFGVHKGIIKRWSADTGKPGVEFRGHTARIRSLAASPAGEFLAARASDDTLCVWEAGTGKALHTLKCVATIEALTFSADGKLLAGQARYGTIVLWDVAAGKPLRRIEASVAGAMAFSPDGKTLAASEGCAIHLWDVPTGTERLSLPGHRGVVNSVAFGADGKTLATGGADAAGLLWKQFDGAKPLSLPDDPGYVYNVAFAPGRPLLAGSGSRGVRLWDAKTGKLVAKRNEAMRTGRAQFFPDGKTLLVAGDVRLAWLWSLDNDQVRRYTEDPVVFAIGDFALVETAVLSPNGKTLVESARLGFTGGIVRDPQTGKQRSEVRGLCRGVGPAAAFATDSTTLAVDERTDAEKIVFVDVPTSTVLRFTPALEDSTSALAFSPDGHTLAVGDYTGAVTLMESATALVRLRFDGHLGAISELAFSPDGNLLATASEDGTVLIWDLARLADLKRVPGALSEKELLALWTDVQSRDARAAYRAIALLGQDAKKTPAFVLEKLRALDKHDPRAVRQLVADLDSGSYAVRDKAHHALAALGDNAGPYLREVLGNKPTLEMRRRAELLVQKLNPPTPTPRQLLALRAMEVLERCPTPEVRQWLEGLARGAPGSWLTREAGLALERLGM